MSWTRWRVLAKGDRWDDDTFDYEGPACYELGTGGPHGGRIQPHYVGETQNEGERMRRYARNGSHLSEIIDRHLKDGWSLYYRGWMLSSKREAVAMQNRLLDEYEYDWNLSLNPR